MKKKIAIIGGGAAGMMAAITASNTGADVTIYEHTDRLGKKILSTGNGKCNLSNEEMNAACFFSGNMNLVASCLERFSTRETRIFFQSLGLCIKDKNGYLYPLAEQAAVVLDVLRHAVEAKGVKVVYQTEIKGLSEGKSSRGKTQICVENGREKSFYDSVILACGSQAAPKTGSDGSGYALAKALGHTIRPVLPSLVQLKCSDSFCKAIAGIRHDAKVHIYAGGKLLCEERGELQLTDYGISGIPVFQLSGLVNRFMYKNKDEVTARIDFLPDYSMEELEGILSERCGNDLYQESSVEEFFTGFLNKKLMLLFVKQAGLQPGASVQSVKKAQLRKVIQLCKGLQMHITGSNGYDNAQVCTGGVDMHEVSEELESKKMNHIYFAGEILDVDGRCGGYNLQWAWTSGYLAGTAATR